MKKVFLLAIFISAKTLIAQDVIYLSNKNKLSGKVILSNNLLTRLSINNNDSIHYDIKNSAIDSIKFMSGIIAKPNEINMINKTRFASQKMKEQKYDSISKNVNSKNDFSMKHVLSIDGNIGTRRISSLNYLLFSKNGRNALSVSLGYNSQNNSRTTIFSSKIGYQFITNPKRKVSMFLEPSITHQYEKYTGFYYNSAERKYYLKESYNNYIIGSISTGGNFVVGKWLFLSPYLSYSINHLMKSELNTIADFSIGLKIGVRIK